MTLASSSNLPFVRGKGETQEEFSLLRKVDVTVRGRNGYGGWGVPRTDPGLTNYVMRPGRCLERVDHSRQKKRGDSPNKDQYLRRPGQPV